MESSESKKKKVKEPCYKKSYVRVTGYEQIKIRNYCLKHHISKSRLMIESAMYCIENNISVKDLFNTE